jgi:hypothetical protein
MTFSRRDDFDILLSPLGSRRSRPSFALAARIELGLKGATIGLLDNSKQNASVLLDEIERVLTAGGARQVLRFRKASAAMSAGSIIDDLAQCHAIVNAFGDCGSCTSWCVHDSVDIEKRGVPVATINTSEFATLGHFEAAALGMPDLPIVAIPHPIGNLGVSAVELHAREAFDDIVTVLTRDVDDRRTDYGVGISGGRVLASSGEDCGCAI